jgi:hypothetical protein
MEPEVENMNEYLNKVPGCVEFGWGFSPPIVALYDEAEHETKSAAEVEMVLTENLTGTCDDKLVSQLPQNRAAAVDVLSREHGRPWSSFAPSTNKQTAVQLTGDELCQ